MAPVPSYEDYDVWRDMFPEVERGRIAAPVSIGVDRATGQMLTGWRHVEQSIQVLFTTRYHERIYREYVGSFVPHLLGENAVPSVITRFFWAMATAISLWEPRYDVRRISIIDAFGNLQTDQQLASVKTANDLRSGHATFKLYGVYMPRGHLGDKSVDMERELVLVGRGVNRWDIV